MKKTRNILQAGAVILALSVLAGCSQTPEKVTANCSLSDSNNVDKLFAEVSDKLEVRSCQYSFPQYRDRLIAAAKGAPGPENEARFAGLLRQSIEVGIISKKQGQETFSRYFDPEFYVVKSEARSSCSSLRHKDKLYADMRSELAYKREGMLEILDDEERFRKAQHYYNDLNIVFDAVNAACTQSL
jgi:outer membrane murein-binding lipoprotein Lpp